MAKNPKRGSRKYPTEESVINEIQRRHTEGLPLNYNAIKAADDSLRLRSETLFGKYAHAVEAAGIPYISVKKDRYVAVRCGHEFERVLSGLLKELGISYKRISHGKHKPDFTFKNGVWMDAKLSHSRVINCQSPTLREYNAICRNLIIVYLIGPDEDRVYGETRLTHVNRYIKQLPKHRQSFYLRKFTSISEKVENSVAA
ncbi:hypothetical protein [Bacillus velezensis]|uniref:hypothetical protein n=1 Tax=Bacillus velezensis TaxID=492670 RepID=UPI0026ED29CF|nr:hypothetical protein [Bacillus velezensis]